MSTDRTLLHESVRAVRLRAWICPLCGRLLRQPHTCYGPVACAHEPTEAVELVPTVAYLESAHA